MPTFEEQALGALRETFKFLYVTFHPNIRRCKPDAIVFDAGSSLRLYGYEVKGSRADWLRELKSNKNRNAQDVCDCWSFIGQEDVIKRFPKYLLRMIGKRGWSCLPMTCDYMRK